MCLNDDPSCVPVIRDPVLAQWFEHFNAVHEVIDNMEPAFRCVLAPWVLEQLTVLAMAMALMTSEQRAICNDQMDAAVMRLPGKVQ